MANKLKQSTKIIILSLFTLLTISTGLIVCANSKLLVMFNKNQAEAQGQEATNLAVIDKDQSVEAREGLTGYITQINNLEDFIAFRDSVNAGNTYAGKTIYLNTDIDLSTICSSTLGSWIPIGNIVDNAQLSFGGIFEGQGHKIDNIYINKSTSNQGLFGAIIGGQVKNLTMASGAVYINSVKTNGQTGSIARIYDWWSNI